MRTNWFIALFIGATEASTRLRSTLWRWIYNRIASRDTSGNFLFMNYGYENKTEPLLTLKIEDEPFRPYIQLYNHVVNDIDLQDKCIAEVGCGRGGGGSFFIRYKNPKSYTGIDISEKAIEWCNHQFVFANAEWKQGAADALPLADHSIDIVINVESSHCYPSMENFLREVKRVLKPNGYFAYCDMRSQSGIVELQNTFSTSGLKIRKQQDITNDVLNGLDFMSDTRNAEINSVFPALFRQTFRHFAGVKDTLVYNMLKKGEMKYFSYLLQSS